MSFNVNTQYFNNVFFINMMIIYKGIWWCKIEHLVTVNDGYLIFRWWLPHPIQTNSKEKPDKGSLNGGKRSPQQSVKSRISIQLSGCDWHYFFNEAIYGTKDETKDEKPKGSSGSMDYLWDLCPYFEIQVLYGRIIMGNPSLPYSLTANLSDGLFHYKKPNQTFRQIFDGHAREFEVHFVPTSDYGHDRLDKPTDNTGQHPNEQTKNIYRENETYTVCVAKKARISYYIDLLPGIKCFL